MKSETEERLTALIEGIETAKVNVRHCLEGNAKIDDHSEYAYSEIARAAAELLNRAACGFRELRMVDRRRRKIEGEGKP